MNKKVTERKSDFEKYVMELGYQFVTEVRFSDHLISFLDLGYFPVKGIFM